MRFNLMQKAAFCALKNSENLYRTIQGCKHSLPKVHGFLLVGTDLIHDQQTYPGTGRQGGTSQSIKPGGYRRLVLLRAATKKQVIRTWGVPHSHAQQMNCDLARQNTGALYSEEAAKGTGASL